MCSRRATRTTTARPAASTSTSRSSAWPRLRADAATGSWPGTAASSPSATRTTTARPAAMHLNQPIVGMIRTRSGHGYWLIARDGGVFSFGDAHFYGSTGNMRLNQPIVGGAATLSGHGYWFVAADGGVFSFGDARFKGSVGGAHLSQPVVGMAADRGGYLLLTANGRVFSFGGAHNYGSATSSCPGAPAVAIATSSEARGYWIAFANARDVRAVTERPSAALRRGPHKRVATSKSGTAATDLFHRLNDERRARGLAPLQWDATLAALRVPLEQGHGRAGQHAPQQHRRPARPVRLRRREHRDGQPGRARPARCTTTGCTPSFTATTSSRPGSGTSASACTARPTARSGRRRSSAGRAARARRPRTAATPRRTRSRGRNPTTRAADRGPGADPDARAVLDPSPGRSRAEGRSRMS